MEENACDHSSASKTQLAFTNPRREKQQTKTNMPIVTEYLFPMNLEQKWRGKKSEKKKPCTHLYLQPPHLDSQASVTPT